MTLFLWAKKPHMRGIHVPLFAGQLNPTIHHDLNASCTTSANNSPEDVTKPGSTTATMGEYEGNAEWSDIEPLPQDDGGPNALATIAYAEAYSEAMSYLRAVMAKGELSERVLSLTEDIIDMNPAHYTVWYVQLRSLTASRPNTLPLSSGVPGA